MMEQRKQCNSCKTKKPITEFYKDKSKKDQKSSDCKGCIKLERQKYYKNNKVKCRENNKNYIQNNKEKLKLKWKWDWDKNKEKHKEKYQNNKSQRKEFNKKYYEKNKDYWKSNDPIILNKRKEYSKEYKKKNHIKIKEYHKKYKSQNKEKINKYQRKRKKEKYENDLDFKFIVNLRVMVYSLYKATKGRKIGKTLDLLGYSVEQFKTRLEYQFTNKMSWSNYGTYWEIDHIKPIDRFIKQGETRPHIINALSNLRPLSIKENRSKRNKF